MVTYNNTICEKELTPSYVHLYDDKEYPQIMIGAIATPGSKTDASNICVSLEKGKNENDMYSFLIDSRDALDFCDYIMKADKYKDLNVMDVKSNMGEGVYSEINIQIFGLDNYITIACGIEAEDFLFDIPKCKIMEFLNEFNKKINDAQLVLDANKNLEKIMKNLKQDMKDGKVEYLEFDIVTDKPKVYGDKCSGKIVKTYSITPHGYDKKPLYTFYRNMYLTGVCNVDFRDHREEFLNCPFVYTDRMVELGKAFLARRQNDLKTFVSNKTKRKK